MLGYTHHWAERWRSTVSGGYVNLDNTASQAGDAYHQTVYASANLIFQYHRRLSIGVETLYGHKETNDGSDGDVARVTAALVYTIFDGGEPTSAGGGRLHVFQARFQLVI